MAKKISIFILEIVANLPDYLQKAPPGATSLSVRASLNLLAPQAMILAEDDRPEERQVDAFRKKIR
jgi:hypothetical protein